MMKSIEKEGVPMMNFTAGATNVNMTEAGAQNVDKSIKSGRAENLPTPVTVASIRGVKQEGRKDIRVQPLQKKK